MFFMKGSSRKKRELSSNGVSRKAMGEGFENNLPSVVRDQKRIQNPPWKQRQNVIVQSIVWENPNPIHE